MNILFSLKIKMKTNTGNYDNGSKNYFIITYIISSKKTKIETVIQQNKSTKKFYHFKCHFIAEQQLFF